MTSSNQVMSVLTIYTLNNTSLTFIKNINTYHVLAFALSSDENLRLREVN